MKYTVASAQTTSAYQVLYLDDDADARTTLARTLRRHPQYEVTLAATADEAVAMAKTRAFDVVLSDLHMPGVGGMEAIAALGRVLPNAAFALITGAAELSLPPEVKDSECIACILRKPWDAEELVATLKHALKLRTPPDRPDAEPPSDAKECFLLLEDTEADTAYMRALLRRTRPDATIVHKDTLFSAVDYLEKNAVTAIIADLGLPDARGIDVVARLQACSPYVPLVIHSGREEETLAMHALDVGAQDYMVKGSVTQPELERALKFAIQRSGALERVSHLAHYDSLTTLANRRLFEERATRALARARRSGKLIGVLMLDLDHFKEINDSLGHEAGDITLQTVARRLQSAARESDTVARLGGDEFVVLVEECADTHALGALAQRIVLSMRPPIALAGQELQVTTSIGIASSQSFSGASVSVDDLLKTADLAMYRAKAKGRNSFQFFDEAMQARARYRQRLSRDLLGALERNEFEISYQPIGSTGAGTAISLEALLRWNHPTEGLIMPSVFIPLLEEVGQIIPVGEWTMRRACAQVSRWRALSGREFVVALNLSQAQFEDEDLETKILRAASAAGLPTSSIALDIEADVLLADGERSARVLSNLRNRDIKTCMDNFGTAKAPLQTLASLPLSIVKLHPSLTREAGSDAGAKVLRCAVAMCASLGALVVAKGVETEAQLRLIEDVPCPYYQGTLYSPALSDIQTTCWVQKTRAPARG